MRHQDKAVVHPLLLLQRVAEQYVLMRYYGPRSSCGHSLCNRDYCLLPALLDVKPRSRKPTRRPQQHQWATEVKARDGSCQECGTTEGLHAHHIDGNHENNTLENGLTLCPEHHRQRHLDLPSLLFT